MTVKVEKHYGCFRCGTIDPPIKTYENDIKKCLCCGEQGIVTFRQALDVINVYYSEDYNLDTNYDDYLCDFREGEEE